MTDIAMDTDTDDLFDGAINLESGCVLRSIFVRRS